MVAACPCCALAYLSMVDPLALVAAPGKGTLSRPHDDLGPPAAGPGKGCLNDLDLPGWLNDLDAPGGRRADLL